MKEGDERSDDRVAEKRPVRVWLESKKVKRNELNALSNFAQSGRRSEREQNTHTRES